MFKQHCDSARNKQASILLPSLRRNSVLLLQKIQETSQKVSEEVRSLDLQIASALRDTAAVASSRQKMNELLSRVQGAAVGLANQVKAQAEQFSAVQVMMGVDCMLRCTSA